MPRVTMPNVIGEAIPKMARARTGIMRVGTVTGTPANYLADVTFDGATVTCNYMAGWVPVSGQRVVAMVHTDAWLILGPAPGVTADLSVGDPASTTSRKFHITQKNATDVWDTSFEIIPPAYQLVVRNYKNAVEQFTLAWQNGGLWAANAGAPGRFIPFATEVGQRAVSTVSSNSGVLSNVTFVAGKFTLPPLVWTQTDSGIFHSWPGTITATKFDIGIRHIDNASSSSTVNVSYLAVQLSSGSTTG